ncbi:MAG: S-adenosyl-l-methionine hydroxide adenosyltransferase family protein [Capsulimonadaceae bacterium]
MRLITLMTDFGLTGTFAGVMKGVIRTISPQSDVVDLTHGIPPHDVEAGCLAWESAWRYFPPGTIHIGVVDPGVGTSRRAIAARICGAVFVCPDNGLITRVALCAGDLRSGRTPNPALITGEDVQVVEIADDRFCLTPISRTFHGRDVFAPAAAHLANGLALADLGPAVTDWVKLAISKPEISPRLIDARIIDFDQYGNARTNVTEAAFAAWISRNVPDVSIHVAGVPVAGPLGAYGDVPAGTVLSVFASHGSLEIAVRNGSARGLLGLRTGDRVSIRQNPKEGLTTEHTEDSERTNGN